VGIGESIMLAPHTINSPDYRSLVAIATFDINQKIEGKEVDAPTLQAYLNIVTTEALKTAPDLNSDVFQNDVILGVAV
jgi:hypothetical protein